MKKRATKTLGVLLIALLGAILSLGAASAYLFLPAAPSGAAAQKVIVQPGSGTNTIAVLLEKEGVVRSRYGFQLAVALLNLRGKAQAGSFTLSPGESPFGLARQLTKGTSDVWITIKEGLRAEEIGEELEKSLPNFDTKSPEFTSECHQYEGFLFPETYLVPTLYNTTQMCRLMREEYGRQLPFDTRKTIHDTGHTEEEIIILASIVEREARSASDKKRVAGILWNRLEIGMPLQVDATLQYVRGYSEAEKNWWPAPRAQDKTLDSPYNTYMNPGLPPGPISNPGKTAIDAAIFPTESDDMYYISSADGSEMYFAETYDEHLQNINLHLR